MLGQGRHDFDGADIMTTLRRVVLGVVAVVLLAPAAAQAQIVRVTGSDTRNIFAIHLGAFHPKGEDSRVEGDVLFNDLNSLFFEIDDFRGFSFGADWTYALTDYIEAGADISFYSNKVPSVYREFVDSDGTEVAQDLKLRLIPVTLSARFLPMGRKSTVQPFVGIGLGIINWRYSETGEFIDFETNPDGDIFRANFVADGTELAPVVIGGIRFLVSDAFTLGGEVRWHKATGDTGGISQGFLGDKIDLGGLTTNFSFGFRF